MATPMYKVDPVNPSAPQHPNCSACPQHYPDVDIEIRGLVAALNNVPGVRTLSSCSGHGKDESQITFTAADQPSLGRLIGRLPFVGCKGRFADGHATVGAVNILVVRRGRGIAYELRVGGHPEYVRREILHTIEQSMG